MPDDDVIIQKDGTHRTYKYISPVLPLVFLLLIFVIILIKLFFTN